ncbi:hypothetical protein F4824DRAFT_506857 [Ustulina deusta]|nr:hypothetical protein F4824DRAFT_506857 [Ustulina deusta]
MSPGQIDSSSTKSVGIGTPVAVDSAALEIETSHSHIQHALNKIEPGPEKDSTMHGLPLVVFTVGMMSIVFLMCFDHYILATSLPRITTDFNIQYMSNRDADPKTSGDDE